MTTERMPQKQIAHTENMNPINARPEKSRLRSWRGAWLILAAIFMLGGAGCSFGGANRSPDIPKLADDKQQSSVRKRRRLRPPINTTRNLYEGSMWRGAASWGNLLRDHRARFRGDLLTVVDLQKIIKVPEVKPETQVQALQNQQQQQQQQEEEQQQAQAENADPILAFLKRQEKRLELIDKEQNEILRSINSVEVQVVRVLSNGNMVVRGVHPPIFRDRNRVKYIVSVSGVVRPSDVDDTNNINAIKLSKAEYQIRRLVRRSGANGNTRAASVRRGRGLFNRFGSFLKGSRSRARQ